MKSEHRHELETNTLSRELAGWIERIKPYTTTIFVGIAVLAGLYFVAMWWSAERAELDRRFWEEFQVTLSDSDPEYEEIRRLAESDDYSGAAGQEWAYLAWADRQLRLASIEYLESRDEALARLDNVAGVYDTLASGAASEEIANRARYGLARVYEMQNKIDDALRQYNMVRGPLSELAATQAERLQDDRSRAAVAWLATADLPRPSTSVSNPSLGQAPDFNVVPPSRGGGPSFDLSRSLDDILGDLTREEGESNRYGEQAETEDTSDGSSSSEDSPPAAADDTDASDGDEPATEVPAESKPAAEPAPSQSPEAAEDDSDAVEELEATESADDAEASAAEPTAEQ